MSCRLSSINSSTKSALKKISCFKMDYKSRLSSKNSGGCFSETISGPITSIWVKSTLWNFSSLTPNLRKLRTMIRQ
jgi:hypothetical protein